MTNGEKLEIVETQNEQIARGAICPECEYTDIHSEVTPEYQCLFCKHRWGVNAFGVRYGF